MFVMMDIDCLETLPDAAKPRELGVDASQNASVCLQYWNIIIYTVCFSFVYRRLEVEALTVLCYNLKRHAVS